MSKKLTASEMAALYSSKGVSSASSGAAGAAAGPVVSVAPGAAVATAAPAYDSYGADGSYSGYYPSGGAVFDYSQAGYGHPGMAASMAAGGYGMPAYGVPMGTAMATPQGYAYAYPAAAYGYAPGATLAPAASAGARTDGGDWPPEFKEYVQRSFLGLTGEAEKEQTLAQLRHLIQAVCARGELYITDWNGLPPLDRLPSYYFMMPNATAPHPYADQVAQQAAMQQQMHFQHQQQQQQQYAAYYAAASAAGSAAAPAPAVPPHSSAGKRKREDPDWGTGTKKHKTELTAEERSRQTALEGIRNAINQRHAAAASTAAGAGATEPADKKPMTHKEVRAARAAAKAAAAAAAATGATGGKGSKHVAMELDASIALSRAGKKPLKAAVYSGGGGGDSIQSQLAHLSSAKMELTDDIDWAKVSISGTCTVLEKRYYRLTSPPDPATVRPLHILQAAVQLFKRTYVDNHNYLYFCDQMKAVRQDLTVQRIKVPFTVDVYETHARVALENGDIDEYNQCQTQLRDLRREGLAGKVPEFFAYRLLYYVLLGNHQALAQTLAEDADGSLRTEADVVHALAVASAVVNGNYVQFFRLYAAAPNMGGYLMDLCAERMRVVALETRLEAYRPEFPVAAFARDVGWEETQAAAWLRAQGGAFTDDECTHINAPQSLANYRALAAAAAAAR